MFYVSQPLDATKNVAQSINYKIKLKQSEFKWYAKKILGFERFSSKIRDIENNCLLIGKNIKELKKAWPTHFTKIFNHIPHV